MQRVHCLQLIQARLRPDDVVVLGLGSTNLDWQRTGFEHPLTYAASDPMGVAPSVALGLALAVPEKRVLLLEGDGDLLMSLGSLATIASAPAPNLRWVVFQNDCYESTGMQPIANAPRVDFVRAAEAAGLQSVFAASSLLEVPLALKGLLAADGPALLVLRIETNRPPYLPAPQWSPAEQRVLFMQALQQARAGGGLPPRNGHAPEAARAAQPA